MTGAGRIDGPTDRLEPVDRSLVRYRAAVLTTTVLATTKTEPVTSEQ